MHVTLSLTTLAKLAKLAKLTSLATTIALLVDITYEVRDKQENVFFFHPSLTLHV